MSDDIFSGIEDEGTREYLRNLQGTQKSAVWDIAYAKFCERINKAASDLTPQEKARAIGEADEAERKNTFGYNYKRDKAGNPQQMGIGSDANPSLNHLAAVRKNEQSGLLSPGSYDREVAKVCKLHPEWSKANGLQQQRA